MLPSLCDSEHCSLTQALPLSWSKSPRLLTHQGGTGSYGARYHSSCHPISLLGSSQQQHSSIPSLHSHIHGSWHCIQASIRKIYTLSFLQHQTKSNMASHTRHKIETLLCSKSSFMHKCYTTMINLFVAQKSSWEGPTSPPWFPLTS